MLNLDSNPSNGVGVGQSNTRDSITDTKPLLKSIIITRCRDGATIDEIIDDFKDFTGEDLMAMFHGRDRIAEHLRSIDGIWSTYNAPSGPFLWYCDSKKSQHLTDMILKQKPQPTHGRKNVETRGQFTNKQYGNVGPHDKYYRDNMNRFQDNLFISKRNAWYRTQNRIVNNHPYVMPQRKQMQMFQRNMYKMDPHFCNYQMIGDDFFLALATWELKYKIDPGYTIEQSGLCISGLTIAEAANRVLTAPYIHDRVILNIGAVDLLHGHDYIDMQQNLLELIKNLEIRGASVILTTLSPLANVSHIPNTYERFQRFNNFIRKSHLKYIDLWKCFVNEKGCTLYECYQPGARRVSGSIQPHVLWNKLGRQIVIKFLKTELAHFV